MTNFQVVKTVSEKATKKSVIFTESENKAYTYDGRVLARTTYSSRGISRTTHTYFYMNPSSRFEKPLPKSLVKLVDGLEFVRDSLVENVVVEVEKI